MRQDDDKYVLHIYVCDHWSMKTVFRVNISEQPIGTKMLCDQCASELDSEQRCRNMHCSEFLPW